MNSTQLEISRGSEVLFARIKPADRFVLRLRGLMFYRRFPQIDGLLLFPCNSVHMFWMNFELDLIYLNRQQMVVHLVEGLKPNRIGPTIKEAYYVLEIPAGTIKIKQIKRGEHLSWL